MSHVIYKFVQHDSGWAYKVGDLFSKPFTTHAAALAAARRAAQEQRTPGRTEAIEWEDENGTWHTETAPHLASMTGSRAGDTGAHRTSGVTHATATGRSSSPSGRASGPPSASEQTGSVCWRPDA